MQLQKFQRGAAEVVIGRRILRTLVLLSLVVPLLSLRATEHVPGHPAVVTHRYGPNQSPPLRIGGFDVTRSQRGSFTEGDFFDQARAAVLANFPETTFHSTSTLTPEFLAEINVLVLTVMSTEQRLVIPLDTSESAALRSFVEQGGCLIALLDNSAFFFPANQSIANPFGVQTGGSTADERASVTRPTANSVTSVPFGIVSSFAQSQATALSAAQSGQCLAVNSIGCALVVIDFGEIGPDAGAAIFFSDTNTFVDDGEITGASFSADQALFLNAVAACAARQPTRRICVGFDAFPDGTPVAPNTVITTQYQPFGVRFSSNDMTAPGLVAVNRFAVSPPNAARAGSPPPPPAPPSAFEMTATFVLPQNPQDRAATNFVAITTANAVQAGLEALIAQDIEGQEVARAEVDFSQPQHVVIVQTPRPVIHQIRLVTRGLIDDFCFAPVVDAEPPQVAVLAPNGGERLALGQPFVIRWTATDGGGIASQDVLLSTDGGQTFPFTIASDLPGDVQLFDWTAPLGNLTEQARIQVVARDDVGNEGRDASDANFSIERIPPEITAIQPNQAGQGTIEDFRVMGTRLFLASRIQFTPSVGITVANPPRVNRDGTEATVSITIAPEAETEPMRVVTITSPNGMSSTMPSEANTFMVLIPARAFAHANPVSVLVPSAPSREFALAAPVSVLFQSAPGQGVALAAPVSALFQAVPTQNFALAAPVSALFRVAPSQGVALAVPVSVLFPSLPAQSFVQALPVSALLERSTEQSLGQALPTQAATTSATNHTKSHEEK